MVLNNIFVLHDQAMLINWNNPMFTIGAYWFTIELVGLFWARTTMEGGIPLDNDAIT